MRRFLLFSLFLLLPSWGPFSPQPLAADDNEVEFTGILSAKNGMEWIVDGRVVVVTSDTELETDNGPLNVGACVEVEGKLLPDGRVAAEEIESVSASKCAGGGTTPGPGPGPNPGPGPGDDDDDDEVEFKGVVRSAPPGNRIGTWDIGGRVVVADAKTEFDTGRGPLDVGACVEVEGRPRPDGSVLAKEIERESPSECGLPGRDPKDDDDDDDDDKRGKIEFEGTIESLPNGLIGMWTIAGRQVVVSATTELEQDDRPFAVGVCVEVEAVRNGDGMLLALEIETESRGDCRSSSGSAGRVELVADLRRMDGPRDWLVGGTRVVLTGDTKLRSQSGPAAVGACLRVKGDTRADGALVASTIDVRSAAGGCSNRPRREVEFEGLVQESPVNGDLGVWLIAGRSVLVESTTKLELGSRRPRTGLCVEVEGRFVDDSVILATSIESEDDDDCGISRRTAPEVELDGKIEALPGSGLTGRWVVAGQGVIVSNTTVLEDDDDGDFVRGACVEVKGRFLANGDIEARKVETEDDDCESSRRRGEIEFRGAVTEGPNGGRLGIWTVGSQRVEVDGSTEIDDDDGRLRVGSCVKVEGARRADGTIRASEIEVKGSSGACVFAGGVVSAARMSGDAVSPGEVLSIFGLQMGPAAGAGLEIGGGRVQSQAGGVRVWFDSTPAPVLFARNDQINVVAPFSLAGKSFVQVQVEWQGAWSQPVRMPVRNVNPGLLTLSQGGAGQAAALNVEADGRVSVNGPANPAREGQAVTLFGVGAGALMQALADGTIVGAGNLPQPQAPVRVTIGGREATVTYAGGAPGLVLGVVQVNVIVPAGAGRGNSVPVVMTVGGEASQPGVTLAIE